MNANLIFETINYALVIVLACLLLFLGRYIYESRREDGWRGLFSRRPVPEQFAVAILIADSGNLILRGGSAAWRSIGGDLSTLGGLLAGTIIGGAAVCAVGLLCKLRVVSIARYGHWPWVACACLVAVFVATFLTVKLV